MGARRRRKGQGGSTHDKTSDANASTTSAAVSEGQTKKLQDVEQEETESDVESVLSTISRVTTSLEDKIPIPASKSTRHTSFLLVIGIAFGVILSLFFLQNNNVVDFEALTEVGLDTLSDVLPVGIMKEARALTQGSKDTMSYDAFAVGLDLRGKGVQANFPVVMIPGVISTGLESWGTTTESRPYFRKRMWGSSTMLKCLLLNRALWKKHIMLNLTTGLDPEGIKLRAAQGFDATDFFITGYWIWNKIIENLATIGYDPVSSYTAAYDWRLSYLNMEKRDQYFTRLKRHIETANEVHKKKTILVSHSMGSQVVFWFLKWAEAEGHGNGGRDWVEKHIEAFINISGSMLGAAKGVPAVLSGEMKDTAQLNQVAVYGLEKFFGREERAEIMRSLPGISSMLPKGGDRIWGNLTWAPDDIDQQPSYGNFIKFHNRNSSHFHHNLTVEGSLEYLLNSTEPWFRDQILNTYSHGIAKTEEELEANENDPRKWINPLEARLPYAPSMKIYCFYGIGKPTERSYFYRHQAVNGSILRATIDTEINNNGTDRGVVVGEGDGTVTLMSQGFMCARGWKEQRYNPAKIPIKIVEMKHDPMSFDMRGGPNTADHVDILGRPQLNELILRIAAGHGDQIEDDIKSDIVKYSNRVDLS